ncbi:hypothetical protein H3H37_21820 [Duganella sp. LX20W]|uniref:Peptidase M12A domain-containing protein n=1 Tax=Rugamonas brunnea TaxID=2758569 RepID=A0A7W2IDL2_9BURK|nr:M12 family metallopeptidase [Rugamonas brunnea]MBA5639701.1 hypothetical protein [Rugamonas brunnea]
MASTSTSVRCWTDRKIPYAFQPDYAYRQAVREAMNQWEQAAGVCFTERGNEADYLVIGAANGGSHSTLGMSNGASHAVINNDYIGVHELGHALGLIHEQTRSDRDQFITVEWEHVDGGHQNGNFRIDADSLSFTPYDRYSVMHYPAPAQGWSGTPPDQEVWTMRWKADHNARLGAGPLASWTTLSGGDREGARALYNRVPGWGNRGTGPTCAMSRAPRCATFKDQVWAVWQGATGSGIWYSTTADGMHWRDQQYIGGVATDCSPCIAVHDGILYCAWRGYGLDAGIWYATNDGTGWSGQQKVPGVGTAEAPALCSFQGRLWLVWTGYGHDGVWFTTFDAAARQWQGQQRIGQLVSQEGPALAVHENTLTLAIRGLGDDRQVYLAHNAGGGWSGAETVPCAVTGNAPSLASYQGKLWLTWKGHGDDRIWWAQRGSDPLGWSGKAYLADCQAYDTPALTVFGQQLVVCWAYAGLSFAKYPQPR